MNDNFFHDDFISTPPKAHLKNNEKRTSFSSKFTYRQLDEFISKQNQEKNKVYRKILPKNRVLKVKLNLNNELLKTRSFQNSMKKNSHETLKDSEEKNRDPPLQTNPSFNSFDPCINTTQKLKSPSKENNNIDDKSYANEVKMSTQSISQQNNMQHNSKIPLHNSQASTYSTLSSSINKTNPQNHNHSFPQDPYSSPHFYNINNLFNQTFPQFSCSNSLNKSDKKQSHHALQKINSPNTEQTSQQNNNQSLKQKSNYNDLQLNFLQLFPLLQSNPALLEHLCRSQKDSHEMRSESIETQQQAIINNFVIMQQFLSQQFMQQTPQQPLQNSFLPHQQSSHSTTVIHTSSHCTSASQPCKPA